VVEIVQYKGCWITIDVANRGRGWTWTYQIDSGPVIANIGAAHPSESLFLYHGLDARQQGGLGARHV
jgi:hypothetical protein